MFGFSKTRTSPRVAELTEKRMKYWKNRYDHKILDTYESIDFLEISTRGHIWRVYGTNEDNFYVVEK
jgi:hypothetical protein